MPTEKVTYCRICEASCGLVATVDDGRLLTLRPDDDHPLSRGFACPKGIAMTDVQNDPDRVLHPLRRTADGTFEQVSWEDALDDIGRRLGEAIDAHGGEGIGWYFGNPTAFSYSHILWVQGLAQAIGMRHVYSAGSQDVNNRFVASHLLYGRPTTVPIPDLDRTDFLLVIGANPVVSHGSLISAPRMREQMKAITGRGGRVVVVDPRRSETARLFEHVAVRPDADAWLLLSLLHVIFEQGLEDARAISRQSRGIGLLRCAATSYAPESTETITGVEAATVRAFARDLATADSAAVYGRTGSCLGRHGTLVAFLIDALALVTGNLDREGGLVFGDPVLPVEEIGHRLGITTYDKRRSRIGDLPDVLGTFPAALMAEEITTPGTGQLRTLFVSAGNPVLSVPNGRALVEALPGLDLFVSLDLYVNETNKHADYVLPTTTWLEREDVPVAFLPFFTQPFAQWTDPVLEAYGEARPEWQIIEDLAHRAGVSVFAPTRLLSPWLVPDVVGRTAGRALAGVRRRLPVQLTPELLVDLGLRAGSKGRLSLGKLKRHPHGLLLAETHRTGRLRRVVHHGGRHPHKVRLDAPEISRELAALTAPADDPAYPLRLIGLRELRSHNSWMHNAPTLMKGKRSHGMRIHPKDAADFGIEDGQPCVVTSPHGEIEVPATVTEDVSVGTVAVPHGWGHAGGWTRANAAGGANVNALASTDPADLERLAGMAFLNGIPVRVGPAPDPAPDPA
ncbi:molybdopterin-dependent oxidoreductase [Nocardioides sp. HDW12B]|uniref:molybdopterin-containing oxidoreductase family protein n=1 Tax=Nocardioides sp. HDW12B TaxID=2714939 RepID=UPI00140C8532|nr:molybdopterin-dependent oxidoreductase [Nocardioides sp. HDW12B]QIK66293.1 molybdopterin-dependent oxidoreductase [Nocardioides sp. HDW12B]